MNKKNVAKIYSAKGNLEKRWFVYFSENGKRVKVYGNINTFDSFETRYEAAKVIVDDLARGKFMS